MSRGLVVAAAVVAVLVAIVAIVLRDGGGDDGDVQAFCLLAAEESEHYETVFDDFDPTEPSSAHDAIETARRDLERLLLEAPPEVRHDLTVLLETLDQLDAAVGDIDPADPSTINDALTPIRDNAAEIDEANARLQTFEQRDCPGAVG